MGESVGVVVSAVIAVCVSEYSVHNLATAVSISGLVVGVDANPLQDAKRITRRKKMNLLAFIVADLPCRVG